jgi:hypothetical protein
MEKDPIIIHWEQDYFLHYTIVSAVTTTELVGDRMSHIVLRYHWCNIVWNVHLPSEKKNYDSRQFLLGITAGF